MAAIAVTGIQMKGTFNNINEAVPFSMV